MIDQTRAPAGSPRPRRRRRLLFVVGAVVLVFALSELVSCATWWLATGSFFTYGRAAAMRDAARDQQGRLPGEGDLEAAARRALRSGDALHPYLGYVYQYRTEHPDTQAPVNRFGFTDFADTLRKRSADRYLVGVIGGSVAAQLSFLAPEVLAAELAKSPKIAGRQVEFVRLALGGYKQPQGVSALMHVLEVGGEFDCVVNLDGFNEVALTGANLEKGVPAYFPHNWSAIAEIRTTLDKQLLIGRLLHLRELRASAAAVGDTFHWTVTGQAMWLLCDRFLGSAVVAASDAVERYTPPKQQFAVTGPGTDGATLQQGLEQMAGVWARSSQIMHAVCAARGIRYFHFLQPNQYVPGSKPIGDAERQVAVDEKHPWCEAVKRGYPLLEKQFPELLGHGVAFRDLRGLFVDHPEPLYVDACCHLNRAGNEILARAVAATIRQHLDFEGAELAELADLRAEPTVLQIADPTATQPLRIIGRRRNGMEIDLTGMPATEVLPSDRTVIGVEPDGSLRGLRRGATVLQIRCRGRELSLPVQCDWPQVVTGKDGLAAPDGRVPLLTMADPGRLTSGTTLRLRADDCPAGLIGVLVVSFWAIPAVLTVEPQSLNGCTVLPLAPVDGTVAVDFAVPAGAALRDHPMLFFRAIFADLAQRRVIAASNSIVVTVD